MLTFALKMYLNNLIWIIMFPSFYRNILTVYTRKTSIHYRKQLSLTKNYDLMPKSYLKYKIESLVTVNSKNANNSLNKF